jgi:hypothetical protein
MRLTCKGSPANESLGGRTAIRSDTVRSRQKKKKKKKKEERNNERKM